jgi:hypothetical protein
VTAKVTVVLQDDIDGSEPAERVHFSFAGRAYEIDLAAEHLAQLQEALVPWIAHARVVGAALIPRPRQGGGPIPPGEIRRWAAEHGVPVRARGRLPDGVRERYLAMLEELSSGGAGVDGSSRLHTERDVG